MREKIAAEIPILRRFARGLARDPVAADDLVQDCIERALEKAHLFDPSRNLRSWLFKILRNLFLNAVRANRTQAANMEAIAIEHKASHIEGPQFDTVLAGQILLAIDQLSVEHRELLLLIAVEGVSYREASEIVGVPIGTIMSRLARAREQLRLQMEGGTRGKIRRVK